ncbi:hypothetical protein BKA64DRAFT_673417 [Cadophora sp. MPI-SDFR-AT-0126]|nr:hypothetical protein BKA64DRAFT_673417 [Leotiomycetes sp. MPI-SDFR-AT-0126]
MVPINRSSGKDGNCRFMGQIHGRPLLTLLFLPLLFVPAVFPYAVRRVDIKEGIFKSILEVYVVRIVTFNMDFGVKFAGDDNIEVLILLGAAGAQQNVVCEAILWKNPNLRAR